MSAFRSLPGNDLVGYLVGLIVLVMVGLGLSLLADGSIKFKEKPARSSPLLAGEARLIKLGESLKIAQREAARHALLVQKAAERDKAVKEFKALESSLRSAEEEVRGLQKGIATLQGDWIEYRKNR